MFILVAALPTALLLTLVPPLRKLAQRNTTVRIIVLFTLGLASFVFCLTMVTGFNSWAMVFMCPGGSTACGYAFIANDYEAHSTAIIREIHARELRPPSLRRLCYTKDTFICDAAEYIMKIEYGKFFGMSPSTEWSPGDCPEECRGRYWKNVETSLISSLVSGILTWCFTRQRRSATESQDNSMDLHPVQTIDWIIGLILIPTSAIAGITVASSIPDYLSSQEVSWRVAGALGIAIYLLSGAIGGIFVGYLPQFAHRVPKIYKKILLITLLVLVIFLYNTIPTEYSGEIGSFIIFLLAGGLSMINSLIVLGITRWIRILLSRPPVKLGRSYYWQVLLFYLTPF
jgi:hypothetical protein